MSKDIYIGVDGGATKCKVRIEDAEGNLIGQAVGGQANIRLSVDISWQSIYQTIQEILHVENMNLHDKQFRYHAGLGLAGCEVREAREAFLSTPHPFATIHLTSDAHVACLGAHAGQDGAIVIIGTGVVGYQIEKNNCQQVGGWGFPHDDMGGGAWLGLEATRLTFQWLDHRIEKTPLLEQIFAYFDKDTNAFATWANRATSNDFAKLAPLVINHCQQNDRLANQLMQTAGQYIDNIAKALEKLQPTHEKLPCCLFGGIAPFIEAWLSPDLRERIRPRQGDANTGAILLVKKIEETQPVY